VWMTSFSARPGAANVSLLRTVVVVAQMTRDRNHCHVLAHGKPAATVCVAVALAHHLRHHDHGHQCRHGHALRLLKHM